MKSTLTHHKSLLIVILVMSAQTLFAQNRKMGDNLGNHKAVQSLNMNSKDVFNVNGIAIGVAAVQNNAIALQVGPATTGTKAMVIPRVDDLLNATAPSIPNVMAIDGMMVFNNADKLFYVRQNGSWVTFGTMSLANGNIYIGDNTNTAVSRILSGDATMNSAGVLTIANDAITTAKIKDLNVTPGKIALTDGNLLIGNSTGAAAGTALSGDVTVANTGVSTIATATKGNSKVLTTTAAGVTTWVDRSQFASTYLNAAQILIGNASNTATASLMSGDATLDATAKLTIANDAITTAKILDANVTTGKIADLNITTGKVADAAITTPKIADLNITTAKIADAAITTAKILDVNITPSKIALTDGNLLIGNTTGAAASTALSGDVTIANTGVSIIATATKGNNKVLTTDNTGLSTWVDRSKFAGTDLNATQILVGNASNMATASLLSGDATLDATAKLTIANNAITTQKISDANVTTAKIADNAITTAKITDLNVTAEKIALANGSVLIGNASGAASMQIIQGDISMNNQGNVLIGAGTRANNMVLTTNIGGTLAWVDRSKFASTDLNATQILIGNASNIATASSMSGDATLDATAKLTIANNAITTAKILDANVTTAKVADAAITTGKILDLNVTPAKIALTDGNVLIGNATGAAAAQALSGDVTIANTGVTTIATATKGNNKVLTTDNTGLSTWVDRSKFASTDLNATQILIGNASNVATASSMSGDATLDAAAKLTIANNAITTVKISDVNVTTAKIADAAITTGKILDANITTAKVADAAITTAKILDLNVTPAKIALTDGNVLIGNTTGAATAKALSGDVTIANTGVSTIATATKGNNKVLTTTAAGVTTWVDKSSISGMMKNIGVLTSNPWSALTTANNAVTVTIPVTGLLQDDGVVVNIKASDAATFDYIMILSSRAENGSVVLRLADMRPMPDTGVYVPPAFSTLNFIVTSYHVQ